MRAVFCQSSRNFISLCVESKVVRAGADLLNREWPCPNFWPHHDSSYKAPSEQISHLRNILNEYTLVLVLFQTENSAEKANRWAPIQKGYGVFVFSSPSPDTPHREQGRGCATLWMKVTCCSNSKPMNMGTGTSPYSDGTWRDGQMNQGEEEDSRV